MCLPGVNRASRSIQATRWTVSMPLASSPMTSIITKWQTSSLLTIRASRQSKDFYNICSLRTQAADVSLNSLGGSDEEKTCFYLDIACPAYVSSVCSRYGYRRECARDHGTTHYAWTEPPAQSARCEQSLGGFWTGTLAR